MKKRSKEIISGTHQTTTRSLVLGIAVFTLIAGAQLQAQPFFTYRCDANVSGRNFALAEIQSSAGFWQDIDAQPFAATWSPQASTLFSFGDGVSASAEVNASFIAGCETRAEALGEGKTKYDFDGTSNTMTYQVGSAHFHEASILRPQVPPTIGDGVTTKSIYENPGAHYLRVSVPFVVAGGDGWIQVSDFELKRTDSGPTKGTTWISWEVFIDQDCDCTFAYGNTPIARGQLRVGPNDSDADLPIRFRAKRGCYLLALTYNTESDMSLRSADCRESVRDESEVLDTASVRFKLTP